MDLNRDNISDATLTYKGSKKYLENFIYLLSCRWFLSYKIEKPSKLFYSLILKNNIKHKVPLFLQSLIYLIRFTINRIPLKKMILNGYVKKIHFYFFKFCTWIKIWRSGKILLKAVGKFT